VLGKALFFRQRWFWHSNPVVGSIALGFGNMVVCRGACRKDVGIFYRAAGVRWPHCLRDVTKMDAFCICTPSPLVPPDPSTTKFDLAQSSWRKAVGALPADLSVSADRTADRCTARCDVRRGLFAGSKVSKSAVEDEGHVDKMVRRTRQRSTLQQFEPLALKFSGALSKPDMLAVRILENSIPSAKKPGKRVLYSPRAHIAGLDWKLGIHFLS